MRIVWETSAGSAFRRVTEAGGLVGRFLGVLRFLQEFIHEWIHVCMRFLWGLLMHPPIDSSIRMFSERYICRPAADSIRSRVLSFPMMSCFVDLV